MPLPVLIEHEFIALKKAGRFLRGASAQSKKAALLEIEKRVAHAESEILAANAEDLARLSPDATRAFRDRLTLTPDRLRGILTSLHQVALLEDPVGEIVEIRELENGLKVRRVRSPLGVLFFVFESRPNVVIEAFSLAFKSGNTIALRGGRDSSSTVAVFYRLIREGLRATGFPETSFYGLTDYDRAHVEGLLKRKDLIDIAIPRGGEKLISFFEQTAVMPIIKNDRGLCHAYVDAEADLAMAVDIVNNGKVQRPGVCNSLETCLVHEKVAGSFLKALAEKTAPSHLKFHADTAALAMMAPVADVSAATAQDWDTEYLDLILNIKIVGSLDEAIAHIEKHGSRHSETIITRSEEAARRFQNEIDAAAVYWNASTRFTDGFELGLGGELGISTQKLHVRGPVGLRELTTPRWIIDGTGQVRK